MEINLLGSTEQSPTHSRVGGDSSIGTWDMFINIWKEFEWGEIVSQIPQPMCNTKTYNVKAQNFLKCCGDQFLVFRQGRI